MHKIYKYFFTRIKMGRPKVHENKSAANKKYCDTYRAKNLTKLREKEKQRKKEAREYEKYVNREKYQERLKIDRQRAREYRGRKKSEKQQEDELQTDHHVLERSDMTYTNPRSLYVYMGKVNGLQKKKYLLWPLRDAWEAINGLGFEDTFGEPLSFSQFYCFINSKKQIILQKDIPDTSCLREVCENASLMA